jgi:hypothetical protein
MDFSPSKSPKVPKNRFGQILSLYTADPKWPDFGLNVYLTSNNEVWYGF